MESQERIWDDVAAGLKAAVREQDIKAAQDEMRRVRAQEAADDAHVDSVNHEYVGAKPRTREDMDTALEAFKDELSKQASIEEPMSRARARHYVMTLIDNELASRKNDKESLIKAGYEKEVE